MTFASTAAELHGQRPWMSAANDYAASQDASLLRKAFSDLRDYFTSAAIWQLKQEPLNASLISLSEVAAEPIQYDEDFITPSTGAIKEATQLLQVLPEEMCRPDISTEPSGAIAFEWYKSPSQTFVLSSNGTGSIEYAALLGPGNEIYGKINFVGDLPLPLRQLLSLFLSTTSTHG